MTSLQLPAFDTSRPPSQHGMSPAPSPLIRPTSQLSAHTPEAMTYSQPGYRPFQPGSIALPLPHQGYSNYPSTAPPMSYYSPDLYGSRLSHGASQGHFVHSATDNTSSRYSSSPPMGVEAVPNSANVAYPLHIAPPSFHFTEPDKHIDPSVFNYSMSRSTSGASDANADGRLLTPHFEYREPFPADAEGRRTSDSRSNGGKFLPSYEFGMGTPHGFFRSPVSSDRGQLKQDFHDTEYERERAEQIMNNRKLMDHIGLGDSYVRARSQPRKVTKRMLGEEHPSRTSTRIASMHRTSYADLDGGPGSDISEEEYEDQDIDEDDFRPPKRTKGRRGYGRQMSYNNNKSRPKVELSLYGLLQTYGQIPHLYPLFYYTLNNDLTINSDSVPLIGSIPSTISPIEKAETLQGFFHRGRRVLAQLDSFTSRCDRKYEGPEDKWSELDFHTRIAVRDVRRKVVERCENYKYTRRDILDKVVGKNKWQPIEEGLVEWHMGGPGDPADDLQNVTLTLPTPPPAAMYAQQQQQQQQRQLMTPYSGRAIRPFPSRGRVASAAPRGIIGASPDYQVTTATQAYYPPITAPPMYGEDQVPMTVQMPGTAPIEAGPSTGTLNPSTMWQDRGLKRERSGSVESTGLE